MHQWVLRVNLIAPGDTLSHGPEMGHDEGYGELGQLFVPHIEVIHLGAHHFSYDDPTSLTTGKWAGDGSEFRAVGLIYPVLVVHDTLLTSPVYGNFFASEFAAHLHPDSTLPGGTFVKGGKRIAPVIVMSVDDLENLETSIEYFAFRDLLADYSSACPDRLISLHDFIAHSVGYRETIYHNRNLASSGLEILDKCGEALFGKKFRD